MEAAREGGASAQSEAQSYLTLNHQVASKLVQGCHLPAHVWSAAYSETRQLIDLERPVPASQGSEAYKFLVVVHPRNLPRLWDNDRPNYSSCRQVVTLFKCLIEIPDHWKLS